MKGTGEQEQEGKIKERRRIKNYGNRGEEKRTKDQKKYKLEKANTKYGNSGCKKDNNNLKSSNIKEKEPTRQSDNR